MNGLSCGEESMTICLAVLIQYQRVTDGQTDGRTDVKPIAITCFSIADARKNEDIHVNKLQWCITAYLCVKMIGATDNTIKFLNTIFIKTANIIQKTAYIHNE